LGDLASIEKRRKRYHRPSINQDVVEILQELREYVENIGQGRIMLIGDAYRQQQIEKVHTTGSYPPWVFGYQIVPLNPDQGFYTRSIFLKIPHQNILDVGAGDIDPIYGAVFESMIDKGADVPEFELCAFDAIKISQDFAITFLHERSPGIVVPGNPATKLPTHLKVNYGSSEKHNRP